MTSYNAYSTGHYRRLQRDSLQPASALPLCWGQCSNTASLRLKYRNEFTGFNHISISRHPHIRPFYCLLIRFVLLDDITEDNWFYIHFRAILNDKLLPHSFVCCSSLLFFTNDLKPWLNADAIFFAPKNNNNSLQSVLLYCSLCHAKRELCHACIWFLPGLNIRTCFLPGPRNLSATMNIIHCS